MSEKPEDSEGLSIDLDAALVSPEGDPEQDVVMDLDDFMVAGLSGETVSPSGGAKSSGSSAKDADSDLREWSDLEFCAGLNFIALHRVAPAVYQGIPVSGHIEDVLESIDESWIFRRWGGGVYRLIRKQTRGQETYSRKTGERLIRLAGPPAAYKGPNGQRYPFGDEETVSPGSPGAPPSPSQPGGAAPMPQAYTDPLKVLEDRRRESESARMTELMFKQMQDQIERERASKAGETDRLVSMLQVMRPDTDAHHRTVEALRTSYEVQLRDARDQLREALRSAQDQMGTLQRQVIEARGEAARAVESANAALREERAKMEQQFTQRESALRTSFREDLRDAKAEAAQQLMAERQQFAERERSLAEAHRVATERVSREAKERVEQAIATARQQVQDARAEMASQFQANLAMATSTGNEGRDLLRHEIANLRERLRESEEREAKLRGQIHNAAAASGPPKDPFSEMLSQVTKVEKLKGLLGGGPPALPMPSAMPPEEKPSLLMDILDKAGPLVGKYLDAVNSSPAAQPASQVPSAMPPQEMLQVMQPQVMQPQVMQPQVMQPQVRQPQAAPQPSTKPRPPAQGGSPNPPTRGAPVQSDPNFEEVVEMARTSLSSLEEDPLPKLRRKLTTLVNVGLVKRWQVNAIARADQDRLVAALARNAEHASRLREIHSALREDWL